MKKSILLLVILALSFTACKDTQTGTPENSPESAVNEETIMNDEAKVVDEAPVVEAEVTPEVKKTVENKVDAAVQGSGATYVTYDASTAASWKGVKQVLFFHADWCPKCQALDKDITDNLSTLPASTAIMKVNYDDSEALKKQYGVIAQDTLVLINADGSVASLKMGASTGDIKNFFSN